MLIIAQIIFIFTWEIPNLNYKLFQKPHIWNSESSVANIQQ